MFAYERYGQLLTANKNTSVRLRLRSIFSPLNDLFGREKMLRKRSLTDVGNAFLLAY
jgi:hypothetical protein